MEIYVRYQVYYTETTRIVRVRSNVTPIGKRKIQIEKRLIMKDDHAVFTITNKLKNKTVTIKVPYN
jgi:hypothetical protein